MGDSDPRIGFFDRHAATWDTEGPPHAEIRARLQALRTRLDLRPGQDLLEAGCGTGRVTAWLAGCVRPGRVTAVDFSPVMLAQAQRRGIEAEFLCLDVCTRDLGVACFDVVLCLDSFPHFRDQPAALRWFARALRPGGRLIILHLDSWQNINAFHDQVGGVVAGDHLPDAATLIQMLGEVHLEMTERTEQPDLFCAIAVRSPDARA